MEITSQIIKDTFFILDSDDLDQVQSHLYGFLIQDNVSMANCPLSEKWKINNNAIGAYIAILRKDRKIKIVQDFISQFYLFLYRHKDYFCISNSFYKMSEYLTEKDHPLTLNKCYADQLISTSLSPASLTQTLANEISIIPMFSDITIDINTKTIIVEEKKRVFSYVDADSPEGMKLLDDFISDWCSLFHAALGVRKFPAMIDLSGGYDSRPVFSIAWKAGLDMNADNIYVQSVVPKTKGQIEHHRGDLETAQEIADALGFQLNRNSGIGNRKKVSGFYAYEIFKNSFMPFHREGYYEKDIYLSPFFHLGGFYGEPVRGYDNNIKKWVNFIASPVKNSPDVYYELFKNYEFLKNHSKNKLETFRKLYMGTRGRHHFGTTVVRDFLLGRVVVSPYFDSRIYCLKFPQNIDENAVFALLIQRTCPRLMVIPFSNGTDFSPETKDYVKMLDRKYRPNIRIDSNSIDFSAIEKLDVTTNDKYDPDESGNDFLYQIFLNGRNRSLFIDEFGSYGEKIYAYAREFFEDKEKFFYNQFVTVIVSIMEFLRIVHDPQQEKTAVFLSKEAEKFPKLEKLSAVVRELDLYKTAHIDLKNSGAAENNIAVNNISDENAVISQPDWFRNDQGSGTIVTSSVGKMKFSIKAIRKGNLKIFLRGMDVHNDNGIRIPIFIQYDRLTVNGSPVFDAPKNIWHDRPFVWSKPVQDGEQIEIELEWYPGR